MATNHSYRPLTPNSPAFELTDEPFVLSGEPSKRQPIGKVLHEMLLESTFKSIHVQVPSEKEKKGSQPLQKPARELTGSVTLLPTPDDEILSISFIPQDQPQHVLTSSTSTTPSPSSGGGGVGAIINFASAPPSGMTLFPRVVVVNPTPNPTPHPTPPATPTPVMSVRMPTAISLSTPASITPHTVSGKLLPSVQFLQPLTPVSSTSPDSSSNNSTLFLHPLSRCSTQPPSTSAQGTTKQPTSTRPSDPGTGTSSASIPRASKAQAVVSPSSGSSGKNPSLNNPHNPVVVLSPQLPPSPDPSSSSICSWSESRTTADTEHSISGITAAVTTGNVKSRSNRCNNEVIANNPPNTGSTILPSSSSGSSSSFRSSGGQAALLPSITQSDAAVSVSARKFYLSSTTTTPSPASGSSFERRSDVSQMSVSSTNDGEGLKQERRIPQSSNHRETSHPNPNLAGPIIETTLSPSPLPRTSPSDSSGSLPLRSTKRASPDSRSSQPHHVACPNPSTSISSQSNTSRRSNGYIHNRGASESSGSRSRSRSRSRNRIVDALTMTSANIVPAKVNDLGGAKPRPRRKGSGDGGGSSKAGGDRGRFVRSQGYGIYQPHSQNSISQTQVLKPQQASTTTVPPQGAQQQSKKFCVGNEDDEDWEDDDESSSMSRSTSLSNSRSRSRSARSHSPSAPGPNGVQQSQSRQPPSPRSPLAQPPIQPSGDVTPQTNGRSTKDSRSLESQKPLSQGRPQKQLGTVLGLNGRKVVVVATDDDDDDYDDDDDDEDWEEEEEEEEDGKVNMKENVPPTKSTGKQGQRKAEEVLDGDDGDWTSASDDDGGVETTVTANAKTGTGTADSARASAVTSTHATTVYTNGSSLQGKGKGKQSQQSPPLTQQQQQQPHNENKPQHYPNPPVPQLLQRAHSSRYAGGTGGLVQLQPPPPPLVKRTHSQQPQQQRQAPPNHHRHHNHNHHPPRHPGVDISQAALEVQRQLDFFEKKPKPAWSDLPRTGSGLLSQLMNPDPDIFPVDHPYRFRYSSGDVGMPKGVARLGVAPSTPTGDGRQQFQQCLPPQQKKSGISSGAPKPSPAPTIRSTSPKVNGCIGRPTAPGLKMSKSAVALPVADAVTAASVKDGGLVNAQKKSQPKTANPSVDGGYRPKGRPQDEVLEDDTDTEGDDRPSAISSVAEQKLAVLAGRRDAAKQQPPSQPKNSSAFIRPNFSGRAVTDTRVALANANPIQIQRTQSQYVPGATATATAPLPLGYPYNLPPAEPPSSPRTTRQLMLRKEMSESVRYNLFWSRQLNRAETSGHRRLSSNDASGSGQGEAGVIVGETNGAGAPPPPAPAPTNISAVPNLVHLSLKKKPGRGALVDATGNGEPSVQGIGWAGDRPPNPRRRSSAAVAGLSQIQNGGDQDFGDVDGQIHVGGGVNLITRTRSWAGLAGGMTRTS